MSASRSVGQENITDAQRSIENSQKGLVSTSGRNIGNGNKKTTSSAVDESEKKKPVSEISVEEMRASIEKFYNNNPQLTENQLETIVLAVKTLAEGNRFLQKEFFDYFGKYKIEVQNKIEVQKGKKVRATTVSKGIIIKEDEFENQREIGPLEKKDRFLTIDSYKTLGPLLFHEWTHHIKPAERSKDYGPNTPRYEADNYAIEIFFAERQKLDPLFIYFLNNNAESVGATASGYGFYTTKMQLYDLFRELDTQKETSEKLKWQKVISDYISEPYNNFIEKYKDSYDVTKLTWFKQR